MKELSRLQRHVLRTAYANRIREDRHGDDEDGADLFSAELLHSYYGFPVHEQPEDDGTPPERWLRETPAPHFHLEKLPPGKYAAAQAAVSRTLRRLEKKGLVARVRGTDEDGYIWAGADLTAAGVEVAAYLMEEQRKRDHSVRPGRQMG